LVGGLRRELSNSGIVTLTDLNRVRLQVRAGIGRVPRSHRPTGQALRGRTAGRNFDGKITRFLLQSRRPEQDHAAETELLNPKLELRPGMYAIVKIGIERKEDALLVPVDALLIEKSGFHSSPSR